jgi:hypothetical protein
VTAWGKRREAAEGHTITDQSRRTRWWHRIEDDKSMRLQILSQSSASLPLQLRGNVRIHILIWFRVWLWFQSILVFQVIPSLLSKFYTLYIFHEDHINITTEIRDIIFSTHTR